MKVREGLYLYLTNLEAEIMEKENAFDCCPVYKTEQFVFQLVDEVDTLAIPASIPISITNVPMFSILFILIIQVFHSIPYHHLCRKPDIRFF